MFKKMKHMKNEKGLTLIELLAVIVILAIIAAIAIPAIGNIINNQRDKSTLSDVSGLISAAKLAYTDGSCTGSTETDAAKLICSDTELADYFKSDKFAAGFSVNMAAATNPVATVTFATANTVKSKKVVDSLRAGIASDTATTGQTTIATTAGTTVGSLIISEKALNKSLE